MANTACMYHNETAQEVTDKDAITLVHYLTQQITAIHYI